MSMMKFLNYEKETKRLLSLSNCFKLKTSSSRGVISVRAKLKESKKERIRSELFMIFIFVFIYENLIKISSDRIASISNAEASSISYSFVYCSNIVDKGSASLPQDKFLAP